MNKHHIYVKDNIWNWAKDTYAALGMSKLIYILLCKLQAGEITITMEDLQNDRKITR